MLHFLQIVLNHVEAVNAAFELARKVSKQRRNFRVFEMLELRHDVIAFLARLHPFDEILQAVAPKPEVINALGKHSREEQRVVANMLSYLAFAVKRGCGTVDRI